MNCLEEHPKMEEFKFDVLFTTEMIGSNVVEISMIFKNYRGQIESLLNNFSWTIRKFRNYNRDIFLNKVFNLKYQTFSFSRFEEASSYLIVRFLLS